MLGVARSLKHMLAYMRVASAALLLLPVAVLAFRMLLPEQYARTPRLVQPDKPSRVKLPAVPWNLHREPRRAELWTEFGCDHRDAGEVWALWQQVDRQYQRGNFYGLARVDYTCPCCQGPSGRMRLCRDCRPDLNRSGGGVETLRGQSIEEPRERCPL